jgi:hypothetical protein
LASIQSAHAQINNGGLQLPDELLAYAITMALPESFSTLQQTLWTHNDLTSSTVANSVQAEWARRNASNTTALYAKSNNNNKSAKQYRQNQGSTSQWCAFHRVDTHNTRDYRNPKADNRNNPNAQAKLATNNSDTATTTLL